ncbi:NTP transferase domain-containing protein [Lichenicoccus sp.]|uniref:phosphocholine cytidylyltransferase family protein n=1 Tax=Lichenicoccus sp. TaxID=2781899 RepID=UPI003D11C7EC
MKCLIVAAGQGVRLREKGELKPLILLKDVPLIEHVIERACIAGLDGFVVVSGYRGEELRSELDRFSAGRDIRIAHVINDAWKRANGVSVLAAKRQLTAPFVLTMCDHLIDPDIYRDLLAAKIEPDTVTLAVDYNIGSSLNDPDDVTRVKCSDGRIQQIGKSLSDFNAIDTGAFLCTPMIFEALEESQAHGDDSISGAMNVLARWGKARVLDVRGKVWLDVDDPAGFGKAERLLDLGRI